MPLICCDSLRLEFILEFTVLTVIIRYTEHSTVGLAQQWDQLNQLGMRIRHNLEQQIQVRYPPPTHPRLLVLVLLVVKSGVAQLDLFRLCVVRFCGWLVI